MKTSIIYNSIVLLFALSAAGCTTLDDDRSGGQTGLRSVTAQLGTPSGQEVTRAVDYNDPTLTPIADRAKAGHVMRITIDGITETYELSGDRFVPAVDPVYFPGGETVDVGFLFADDNGGIADQNGSLDALLAADALTATMPIKPAASVDNVTLTHANSLIDLKFADDVDIDLISYLIIGGVRAHKTKDGYLAIIDPDSDDFAVTFTYDGVAGYEIVIDKSSVPNDGEFAPNCRYTLTLGIDETYLSLRAVSIAPWADGGTVPTTLIKTLSITINNPLFGNKAIYINFSNGDSYILDTDQQGTATMLVTSPAVVELINMFDATTGQPISDIIYIGRTAGKDITLDLDDDGHLIFRPADADGYIPIGTYSEFAMINTDGASLAGLYRQEADLDLLGFPDEETYKQNWVPIGNIEHKFTGVYDGGGYKIENIYIDLGSSDDGTSDGAGLFGYCDEGKLSNIQIASGSIAGRNKVGGVCGWSSGEIALCSNSAAITGNDNVGGVCGENNHGTISWCSNTGNVSGNYQVGGVCGRNYGTVSGCYNSGEVKGNDNKVGGVCGDNNDTVSGCYNTGNVSGKDEVGGVCGENNDTVSGCYNTGNVSGNREVGGVCGRLYGQEEAAPDDPEFVFNPAKLIECYSAAAVTGTGEVGGVCGQILTNDNYPDDKGEIIHCFWGVGIGVGTSPEKAVGGGDAADGSTYYEFSDTNWPTTTGDYWKLFSNGGVWESLGAWGGSPINSTYPVLSSFR